MPPLSMPLANSKFTLNSAGVAGFFGGKEAISAMATVHLYKGRRWLGWYNSPGSYTIAKRLGRMANSRFWDGLFPGPNDPPAITFGLDGRPGPKYSALLSGTEMQTGHLGYLTMEMSKGRKPKEIQGRETSPVFVSYLAMNMVDYDTPVQLLPLRKALLAIIPITCSVAACILSALVYDWYSFYMILLGIISSGLASLFIGEGQLVLKSVRSPAKGSPPGHGILMEGNEVVVIKGSERDVNAITKGHFDLETDSKQSDDGMCSEEKNSRLGGKKKDSLQGYGGNGILCRYHAIGCCSLLFVVQFLLQLFLIPQASLFGQVMFLSSLGVSWAYNAYLSSLEKEKIQTKMLFEKFDNPQMVRFRAGTRTAMAVFVCLLLLHGVDVSEEEERCLRTKALRSCIPNDTAMWGRWLDKVVEQLLYLPDNKPELYPYLEEDDEDHRILSKPEDNNLLKTLLGDAKSAIDGYYNFRDELAGNSNHQYANGY